MYTPFSERASDQKIYITKPSIPKWCDETYKLHLMTNNQGEKLLKNAENSIDTAMLSYDSNCIK